MWILTEINLEKNSGILSLQEYIIISLSTTKIKAFLSS